LIIQVDPKVSF